MSREAITEGIMDHFTCCECGGQFHEDSRGFDGMCVDCSEVWSQSFYDFMADREREQAAEQILYKVEE